MDAYFIIISFAVKLNQDTPCMNVCTTKMLFVAFAFGSSFSYYVCVSHYLYL